MGFCFFNNVSVAAKWLRTVYGSGTQKDVNGKEIKMNRILILDWDVHHGASSLVDQPAGSALTQNTLCQATARSARSKTMTTFSTSRCTATGMASTRAETTVLSSRSDPVAVAGCESLPSR